jgi:AcrR family transcriptional regulator
MPPTNATTTSEPIGSPLNRERVLAGAVALADEVGIDAFTIRKLAAHLGVKPMTIYHHVPNKDAIIDGMVDAVFREIDTPPTELHWRAALQHRARSARAVLARHRWASPLMESRTNPGPETLHHHDAVLGCLRRAGFSLEMTAHAYALLDAFVYGFALQEANLPATEGADMVTLAETITAQFADGEYPYLQEFTTNHVLQPGYDFGAEFEFGLSLVLDGLGDPDPAT